MCVCVCASARSYFGSSFVRTHILFALFATHRFTMPKAMKQATKKAAKRSMKKAAEQAMKKAKMFPAFRGAGRLRRAVPPPSVEMKEC